MLLRLVNLLLCVALGTVTMLDVANADDAMKREAQVALRQADRYLVGDQFEQALLQVRRAEEIIETLSTEASQPRAQVAPQDARFNGPLRIQLDNTASVLDFVSFPGGDREDRVRWDVVGMNSNPSLPGGRARLVIVVSCFGKNTEQLQIKVGRDARVFSCGETIFDKQVTASTKTGSVTISARGGQDTYVQWVLTGTATRIN